MAIPKDHPALWAQLVSLPLDRLPGEPPPAYRFETRLCDERGWDYATALRAIAEYRRFLFLAALGPACPPEAVDAVWHLHLTYSRPYRAGLCEGVLGRPLDHAPSSGTADTALYRQRYEETLVRYAETFGVQAPAEIWPPVAERFASGTRRAVVAGWSGAALFGIAVTFWFWSLTKSVGAFAAFAMVCIFAVAAAGQSYAKRRPGRNGDGGGCGIGAGDGGSGCGGGCGGGCG